MNNPLRRRAPRNTEREARENPFIPVGQAWADVLLGGKPTASIIASEKAGQRQFVNSDTLPTQISPDDRATLEAAGVKFGEVVDGDPIFQYVELPAGWTKRGTGHDMWSDLLDDKGQKRASIFYKAAFYDRNAHLNTEHRYAVEFDYDRVDREQVAVANVTDCGKVIYSTEPIPTAEGTHRYDSAISEPARQLALEWLDEHYPDWKDASAYWD